MYQIFFVFTTSERETEREATQFSILQQLSFVRSCVACHPKLQCGCCIFAQSQKSLRNARESRLEERGQPQLAQLQSQSLIKPRFLSTLFCVLSSFLFLFFRHYVLMYFFHFSLAESHMAPSTWSEATSRVWLSTTSPMSIRASTSAGRPATSMARSVSPYPIPFHCKLWVSLCVPVSVYSYVLCTCCCG